MKKNLFVLSSFVLFILFLVCGIIYFANNNFSFQKFFSVYSNVPKDSNGFLKKDEKKIRFLIENNSEAKYYLFLPDKKKATGQAVIICPGGGYQYLVLKNEGLSVARWLSNNGIAGIVLLYRMPNKNYHYIPLEDIHETIKLVRKNSDKWNINPNKVGVMGFSAGGHLAATASNNFNELNKQNFSILYYPVISMSDKYTNAPSKFNLLGENNKKLSNFYSNELRVTSKTPPTYIAYSSNDQAVNPENSKIYYNELKKNKVSVEMHVYDKGNHGWGWSKRFKYHKKDCDSLLKWLKSL